MKCSAMKCRALKCSAAQCSAAQWCKELTSGLSTSIQYQHMQWSGLYWYLEAKVLFLPKWLLLRCTGFTLFNFIVFVISKPCRTAVMVTDNQHSMHLILYNLQQLADRMMKLLLIIIFFCCVLFSTVVLTKEINGDLNVLFRSW